MSSTPPSSPPPRDESPGPTAVLWAVVDAVRDENVTLLAAGIAYYAFVSLVPLLLLALSVAAIVGGEYLAGQVLAATDRLLTPEAQSLVEETLRANAAAGGASVIGLAVLTWSGLKLFRGLDRAFSQVYGFDGGKGLIAEIRDGIVVLVTIGLGTLAVAVAGGAVLRLFGVSRLLAPLLSTVGLFAAFLPLFYVFPDTPVSVREVVPGTVLAAVGWTALGSLFGIYAAVAGGSVYGVLGGVLLVVTWLYLGALIVMLGAVVNATLAGVAVEQPLPEMTADRQVQQAGASDSTTAMSEDGEEVEPERDDAAGTASTPAGDGAAPGDGTGAGAPGEDGAGPEPRGGGPSHPDRPDAETAEEIAAMRTDLEQLREQLDETERRLEEKTVSRSELEGDLRQYVRARVRRGHARGWGPYLVLLYGTAMTLGAFFYLEGIWAIGAMLVIWLSTLGLYALMVLVGMGLGIAGGLGKVRDVVGKLRR